jgi:hypothetical protein
MLATDYNLIPLTALHKHEAAVLRGLDSLPISYAKSLLEEPAIRYAFLYYALLTHWPELVGTHIAPEELLYNRFYWFLRMSKQFQINHDFDAAFERQGQALLETANREFGSETVHEIDQGVLAELMTNEKEIAVAFSDFTIGKVMKQFDLQLDESGDFFASAGSVLVNPPLLEVLREQIPLGLAIGTEKARSEYIVAPILAEVRRQLANTISVFSGIELDVDPTQGLRGVCDFLLCNSPHQLVFQAPVIAVVEAKKEDIAAGLGQCLAEMVAARIFNEQNQSPISAIHGIVTTGNTWKFLRLIDSTAYVDVAEYHISDVPRIVGIVVSMFDRNHMPKKT